MNTAALDAKPVLHGGRVRLEPLAPAHAGAMWRTLQDPELRRLTGSHAGFTQEQIERWCASRAAQPGRLDLAVVEARSGSYLGELALNALDEANETMNYRIALDTGVVGQGYGTEATELVLAHAFTAVVLHRVELEVYAFNPRAERAYVKAGFEREGVRRDALLWDGARHDAVVMAALRPRWLARATVPG